MGAKGRKGPGPGKMLAAAGMALLLSVVFLLCGCVASTSPVKPEEPEMHTALRDGQTVYNGTERRFYQVEAGKTGELRIAVRAESGSLNISLFPTEEPERFCYRGRDIPTSAFSVTLQEPGEYTVWIEAEDFAGSYTFEWFTG